MQSIRARFAESAEAATIPAASSHPLPSVHRGARVASPTFATSSAPSTGCSCHPSPAAGDVMSSAKDRSRSSSSTDRVRRQEDEQPQMAAEDDQMPQPATHAVFTSAASNPTELSAMDEPQPQSNGMQPLDEQMRKRPGRSPRFQSSFDLLAVVELQLVMQFLDTDGKLKMARCSRRLLQAASHPFAWKGAPPFVVEVRTPDGVERIALSLLRFAPIHLRCMVSLDCVVAVPHLRGLELRESPEQAAASLAHLLQRPCTERLRSLRVDQSSSWALLTVGTMRLIAALPQLRALDLWLPGSLPVGVAMLQPLVDAPVLEELALRALGHRACGDLMKAIGRIGGLSVLSLQGFSIIAPAAVQQGGPANWLVLEPSGALVVPTADAHQAALRSMRQLRSLTLQYVNGINMLLPHLHLSPSLPLLTILCRPSKHAPGDALSSHPTWPILRELLTVVPQIQVRLVLLAPLDHWLSIIHPVIRSRASIEEQWNELHRMAAELERVSIVYDESL